MTRFHIYICYISDDVTQKLITTEYFNSTKSVIFQQQQQKLYTKN